MVVNYIIPICNVNGGLEFEKRLYNLNYTINNFLSKQKEVELKIILIEQITNKDNHIFVNNVSIPKNINCCVEIVKHEVFIKQWLCNIGFKKSDGDNCIIGESDIYSEDETYLLSFMNFVFEHKLKWCFGWETIIQWNEKHDECSFYSKPRFGHQEGGVVYFNKLFWQCEMYGANELLVGKGANCNDNELAFRAHKLSNTYMNFFDKVHHLWHPKESWKNSDNLKYNNDLFWYTVSNFGKVQRFLSNNSGKLGLSDKPLNVDIKTLYNTR